MTLMLMKYQFLKKNHVAQRMHLNTLLDIMIMMSLDLCLRLPQMSGYVKKFNENAAMSFRANNKHFLKNYNKI